MLPWATVALYRSQAKMPDTHAQAGAGITKKMRNVARGWMHANADMMAYTEPEYGCVSVSAA